MKIRCFRKPCICVLPGQITVLCLGGKFNRSAVVEFESTGDELTIRQAFTGQDAQGHMRITTYVDGQLPDIADDEQVELGDYYEEYRRTSPGE